MVVVWSKKARLELKKVFNYIALDSLKHAILVRDEIIDLTIALSEHSEKYALDNIRSTMMVVGESSKNIITGCHIKSLLPKYE